MKIAIVAFDFVESSLSLARHLAKTEDVSYFVITSNTRLNQAGLDLSERFFFPGVNQIAIPKHTQLKEFLQHSTLQMLAIHYLPGRSIFNGINNQIQKKAINFINNQKFDIVNIVGQHDELINYHRMITAVKVHTFHEVYNHQDDAPLQSGLLKYIVDSQCPIILHSEYNKAKFISLYPQRQPDVYYIPFSAFEVYQPYIDESIITDPNKILFFGNVTRYKGIDILLQAFKQVTISYPLLKLVIAGKVKDFSLAKLYDGTMPDGVTFINKFLNNKEIIEQIQTSKIIVCPYLSASQSGIPALAFLLHKCIIATKVGAFTETISNGKTGYLIDSNNVTALADCIFALLENKEKIDYIEENLKRIDENRPQNRWLNIALNTVAVYQIIIDSSSQKLIKI